MLHLFIFILDRAAVGVGCTRDITLGNHSAAQLEDAVKYDSLNLNDRPLWISKGANLMQADFGQNKQVTFATGLDMQTKPLAYVSLPEGVVMKYSALVDDGMVNRSLFWHMNIDVEANFTAIGRSNVDFSELNDRLSGNLFPVFTGFFEGVTDSTGKYTTDGQRKAISFLPGGTFYGVDNHGTDTSDYCEQLFGAVEDRVFNCSDSGHP